MKKYSNILNKDQAKSLYTMFLFEVSKSFYERNEAGPHADFCLASSKLLNKKELESCHGKVRKMLKKDGINSWA